MSLEKYKLDKSFTEGVDVVLEDVPEHTFRIRLPSQYNRAYMSAMYSGIDVENLSETMKKGGSVLQTRYAQQDAFINTCLISMDGEPIPADFFVEYAPLLDVLMAKANELANDIENRVEDNVKKSPSSSVGKANGRAGKSSTVALSAGAN
jgi:hypothetical protein